MNYVKNVTDDNFYADINNSVSVNILIDMNVVCNLLKISVKCISCDGEKCIEIFEDVNCRKGLSSKLNIVCSVYGAKQSNYISGSTRNRMYNVNVRLAYAMRCIGKGWKAAQTFCAIMDLPPPQKFECYNKVLLDSLVDVSNMSMRNAVKEAVEMNDGNKHESLNRCIWDRIPKSICGTAHFEN
jgi:hypothetical protein